MLKYTLRRILAAIPTLLIVGAMIFILIRCVPGNPAQVMLPDDATAEEIAAMEVKLGLDKPYIVQFTQWIGNAIKGDLGESLFYHEPVLDLIVERLEPTWLLVLYGMTIAILLGVTLGVIAAMHRNRFLDKLCTTVSVFGISMPGFWIGMNLVILLAVKNPIFPSSEYVPLSEGSLSTTLYYLTLPAIAMGLQRAASLTRVTRSSMLDVLGSDYIRTARAKGLKERTIICLHALKNAANPIMTQIGISIAHVMGGSIVIEKLFNIPGIGRLAYDSVTRRDYPMIQGHVLFVAVLYVGINLIVDLLYKAFDPRIKFN